MVKSRLILKANSIWKIESYSCQYVNLYLMLRKSIQHLQRKQTKDCIAFQYHTEYGLTNPPTEYLDSPGLRLSFISYLLFFKKFAFIYFYFWLHWVFVAVHSTLWLWRWGLPFVMMLGLFVVVGSPAVGSRL